MWHRLKRKQYASSKLFNSLGFIKYHGNAWGSIGNIL